MNERKRLTRPRTGRMLAGVCAGLADFFSLDASLIRIAYVLLTIFTAFAGVLVYILMWIIVPEEKNHTFDR
ncbi:MAG: PspC domain-containing protein [Prevotellaceae bacterium]|jgi:phage shock protein PspC (stress-responsive transcriptional regulator)|nr:PspC domain-containing protein [Prevotellaceae bacterium]